MANHSVRVDWTYLAHLSTGCVGKYAVYVGQQCKLPNVESGRQRANRTNLETVKGG